ncbi:MAG: hypothetical protein AAFX04_03900 [Pseudomonadota bacterium]
MPSTSQSVVDKLCWTKPLADMSEGQKALILALRTCVLANVEGRCCCGHLAQYLGSAHSVGTFMNMLRTIVAAWPESLIVHRPFCYTTTYDEVLIVDLVTATIKNDSQRFHAMLRDMMPRAAIFSIQRTVREFVDTLPGRDIAPAESP